MAGHHPLHPTTPSTTRIPFKCSTHNSFLTSLACDISRSPLVHIPVMLSTTNSHTTSNHLNAVPSQLSIAAPSSKPSLQPSCGHQSPPLLTSLQHLVANLSIFLMQDLPSFVATCLPVTSLICKLYRGQSITICHYPSSKSRHKTFQPSKCPTCGTPYQISLPPTPTLASPCLKTTHMYKNAPSTCKTPFFCAPLSSMPPCHPPHTGPKWH